MIETALPAWSRTSLDHLTVTRLMLGVAVLADMASSPIDPINILLHVIAIIISDILVKGIEFLIRKWGIRRSIDA